MHLRGAFLCKEVDSTLAKELRFSFWILQEKSEFAKAALPWASCVSLTELLQGLELPLGLLRGASQKIWLL